MDFSEIEKEIPQDLTAEWMDFYFYIYSVKNIKVLNEQHYRAMKKSSENEKIMRLKCLYQKDKQDRINQELKGELREVKEELQKVSKEYQSLKDEHSELNKHHKNLKKTMEELSNSWSYKIGRMVTVAPRKARYIINKYIIKNR